MAARILRVLIEVRINSTERRFRVPLGVLDFLGLNYRGNVALVIRNRNGRLLYGGTHYMLSKAEVYGKDMKRLPMGRRVYVEVSRP